jgi:hypothetical protein
VSVPYDPALPLHFHHIPKTAGTSVATMLAATFGDRICPVTHWDTIMTIPEETLDGYQVFIGHYAAYLPRFLGKNLNKFTIFRDPVERTVSHYSHIKRAGHHHFHQAAKDLSLLDFVRNPITAHNVVNYQARYVADLGLDPREIAKTFVAPEGIRTPLHMHIDELSRSFTSDALRTAALASLDTYFAVGVTQDIDALMQRVSAECGRDLGPIITTNVDPAAATRNELDRETRRAIEDATQIDHELYELAKARARDFAAMR